MMLHRLKLTFSLLGLLLAIAAIAVGDTRITWAAIAMLVISVVMRIVIRRREKRTERGE